MRKKEESGAGRPLRLLKAVLVGGAAALALCMVLLAVLTALVAGGTLGEKELYPIMVGMCAVAGFTGGRIAGAVSGRRLSAGIGAGAVYAVLLLLAGMLLLDDPVWRVESMGALLAAVGGGAVAGLLRGKRKKKRRK